MGLASYLTSPDTPSVNTDWHATEPWVRYGMRTVVYLCGGLLIGSMLFSISGAVVTSGTVGVEGEYKTVQHLEGGIVSKILVHNGDRVAAGDVLIQLDDTQTRASMLSTSAKFSEFAIQEARLIAERERLEQFAAPASVDMTSSENIKLMDAQKALFDARRTAYRGQQSVLNQRITQTESELTGATGQLESRNKELTLNELELSNVRPLFEKGFVNMQRIGPLQRENVRIRGDLINLKAQIAKLKSGRSEAEARLSQVDKEYTQQAAEELQKAQAGLAEQTEARKAVSDKLGRTEIRAPASGVVHALAVHTEGGVIQPGSMLLQIIPEDRKLLIEAKVMPKDIDRVHSGQPATVRFSAFDSHVTPRLEGIVRKVSAAEITDKEGHIFYTTQIEVPPTELMKLDSGHRLVPGMPAEVYLETQSRSILSYFLKPLTDMLAQTFRER
ncbi:MAG TPA: HlyD family type I secretion periplasmic adaptor subunit [Hyphomicrobium sp.]|nr:HlyD family type I secretion periplasmic adaptor subunit [Hyphomicrobium sp.]